LISGCSELRFGGIGINLLLTMFVQDDLGAFALATGQLRSFGTSFMVKLFSQKSRDRQKRAKERNIRLQSLTRQIDRCSGPGGTEAGA
jgi:hypothetical protein